MVNPAWGKKRVCSGCSVRFYDLCNPAPVCPKCGTPVDLQLLLKPKRRTVESVTHDDLKDIEDLDLPTADADLDAVALDDDVLEDEAFDDDLAGIKPLSSDDIDL